MLLTTRNPEMETLRQELQTINTKLQLSLDIEMQKLKEQEKELQEALKLKTRTDLIKAMENELAMDNLEESILNFKTISNFNSSLPQTYNRNSSEFLRNLNIEEDLDKSHQILDKLIREHNDQSQASMIQSLNTNLKYLPNPNVVFSKSSRYSRTPQKKVKTVTIYRKPAEQNLNDQQTLVYGDSLKISKSLSDLDRSSYFDNSHFSSTYNPYTIPNYNHNQHAKSSRDSYFYSDKETINGIPKSRIRKTAYLQNRDNGYTVLPISKTVVHKKPWSYGKVETNYYPFRDSMLKKK